MNTTSSVVATAAIVTVGKMVEDEPLSPRIMVGGAFLAIGLAIMDQANPKFASRFALLILMVATFTYVPNIAYHAGLINKKPPQWDIILTGNKGSGTGRKK